MESPEHWLDAVRDVRRFSLIFVAALFLVHVGNIEKIMFWAFIIGNIMYYGLGILLAFIYQGQPRFLLVSLSNHGVVEADELFRADPCEMR